METLQREHRPKSLFFISINYHNHSYSEKYVLSNEGSFGHSFCVWEKPNIFASECGPLSSMWVANWKVFCEEYQKQFFAFISTLTSKQELLYHILQKHFQHCVICNEFRNEAVNMSKNVQKLFSVTFQMVSH